MKEQLKELIQELASKRPYQVSGMPETYCDYNQGWSDACDALESKLYEYSPWISVEDALPEYEQEVLASRILYSGTGEDAEPCPVFDIVTYGDDGFYRGWGFGVLVGPLKVDFWQPIEPPNQ